MKTLQKIIIIFLAITGAYVLLLKFTDVKFGNHDFFDKHTWFFLISMAIFPRLTLLVSGLIAHSIEFGGLVWWLGFFVAPRILVAILATVSYWNQNQILVIIAWLFAIGGESSEKFVITKRMQSTPQNFRNFEGETIEAEFKVKEDV
jgi:hypothetical protein